MVDSVSKLVAIETYNDDPLPRFSTVRKVDKAMASLNLTFHHSRFRAYAMVYNSQYFFGCVLLALGLT